MEDGVNHEKKSDGRGVLIYLTFGKRKERLI
jgi:hypothetical protein